MGLSLQFLVVLVALAATFSLTFATHYHDGEQIKVAKIEGEVYCSSDGNKQSSSTRKLAGAKTYLTCDEGETILYETITKHDGEFEMEIKDQTKVDIIMHDFKNCSIIVPLPAANCLLAPSNGVLQSYLDPDVKYVGSHAFFDVLPSKYESCL